MPTTSPLLFYSQMDYVLFLYGFALIALAGICVTTRRIKGKPLPWPWLGLFALTHGVYTWLEMTAISHPPGPFWLSLMLALEILSLLLLVEFARKGLRSLGHWSPGGWVHLLLLGVAITCDQLCGLYSDLAYRWVLGVTGGLGAARVLWIAAGEEGTTRHWLRVASGGLVGYALCLGLAASSEGSLSTAVLTRDAFLSLFHFPVDIPRAGLIAVVMVALWRRNRMACEEAYSELRRKPSRSAYLGVMILLTLGVGWLFTEKVGLKEDGQTREYILQQASLGVAAVEGRRLQGLAGLASDTNHVNYQRLRRLLGKMNRPALTLRCVYLLFQREDGIYFSADSLPKSDPLHAEPGTHYISPPEELKGVFSNGIPLVVGPYTDEWGNFVSAFAPVTESSTGPVIAVLGVDIEQAQWSRKVAEWRLEGIEITLLVATLLVAGFVMRQRLIDDTNRLAVNERRMAEAQRIASVGSWDWFPRENRVEWSEEAGAIIEGRRASGGGSFEYCTRHVHPDDWAVFKAAAQRLLDQKEPVSVEHRVLRPDGSVRVVLEQAQTVFDKEGKPLHVLGIIQDITERKKLETALRDGEARFRTLFEHAPLAIATLRKTVILDVNPAFLHLTGFKSTGDIVGRPLAQFLAPREREWVCARALRREQGLPEPNNYETVGLRADGVEIPVQVSVNLMELPDGLAAVVFFQDVTERKRTELELQRHRDQLEERVRERTRELTGANLALQEEVAERRRAEELLRRSEARMRLYFERQLVGMAITSPDKAFLQVNDRMCQMFGYAREELIQHTWADLTYPEDLPTNVANFNDLAAGRVDGFTAEKRFIRKDGAILYSSIAVGCVRNPDGTLDFVLLLVEDITDRKLAEMETRKLLAELARSNKELEQFAYVASHDLQEPLRLVSAYTQMLVQRYKPKLDADATPIVNFITEGVGRMQQLILDLLSYSRVSSRSHPFTPASSEELLLGALKNLAFSIQESQAAITHDPLPQLVCDPTQMGQLFQNLIGNAIKFCGELPPKIHIGVRKSSDGTGWLFSVADNGIGIEPEFHERIFVIFQRLHSRTKYKGTGIGLAICKRVVERHGGRIWVESSTGKGSIFYFTIPFQQPSHDIIASNE
jgi:PAS domain S-box-containing protein